MEFHRLITDARLRNTALIIFGLLCLNKLGIYVTGSEEQYLGLAKQYINPNWIPGSFSLTEPPGTRLLFQLIVGPVMQVLDFVTAVFVLRLVNFALLAVPLALIFRRFGLSLIETFVIGQFLIMGPQCFFGGEWIYNNFEAKTLAYVFLFYSLYYLMEERWQRSAVFAVIASYFHLLVGGWFVLAVGISMLLRGSLLKQWRFILIYGVSTLPLVIYILLTHHTAQADDIPVNLDWVYVYYRNPHHLGLFRDFQYFLSEHGIGVGAGVAAFVFALWRQPQLSGLHHRMNTLTVIMLGITLFFAAVALLDHLVLANSGGLLLKTYPFRLSSMAYFLFVMLLYQYIRQKWPPGPLAGRIIVGVFVVLTLLFTASNVRRSFDSFRDPDFDAMARDIRSFTGKSDVFVILDKGEVGVMYNSFSRKAERENFSVFKFVLPNDQHRLYEWYQRHQAWLRLNDDIRYLAEMQAEYDIDYLLSKGEVSSDLLTLVHRNDSYFLYRIE